LIPNLERETGADSLSLILTADERSWNYAKGIPFTHRCPMAKPYCKPALELEFFWSESLAKTVDNES
jgi:hypothetical protein